MRIKTSLALIGLLLLLATLQYRWLGQVSEAERERMRASLTVASERFAQDFNRELTRLFLTFQVEPGRSPEELREILPERWELWNASAVYPAMLDEVFWAERVPRSHWRLARLEPETLDWAATEWPPELGALHARLELARSARIRPHLGMNGSIPAIVLPYRSASGGFRGGRPRVLFGGIILLLSRETLSGEVLPDLARRHFGSSSATDYELTVVDRERPQQVIWSSEAGASRNAPDLTVSLFHFVAGPEYRSLQTQIAASTRDSRLARERARPLRPPRPPPPELGMTTDPQAGDWELRVSHRAGSLEAAVAAARRRNLAISFGILLLLGVSVALLVGSSQRAHRLAQRQMEFVAGVSHELRTPLSVIRSAAQNLAAGTIEDSERTKSYGSLIEREGRRLSEMIERLLELAGVESGRQTSAFRDVSIPEVIDAALADCAPQLEEAGLQVETRLAPDLGPIQGDGSALRQAIGNLVANAAKHGASGGRLAVRAEKRSGRSGQEVAVTVEDRGPGIDPADLPHLFEPFYRGRNASLGRARGSGLGLHLVRRIAELHGGRVTVDSAPGRGSAFTLHLPAAPERRAET